MPPVHSRTDSSVWLVQWIRGYVVVCLRDTAILFQVRGTTAPWIFPIRAWSLLGGQVANCSVNALDATDARIAKETAVQRIDVFGRCGDARLVDYPSAVLHYDPTWSREFWLGDAAQLRDQFVQLIAERS